MAIMSSANEANAVGRSSKQQPPSRSLFSVPAPIKQLFDQFPLLTYPVNDLPQRAPQHRNAHVLHVFTTDNGAARGAPSYNPACLKWQVSPPASAPRAPLLKLTICQAYLKFSKIPFHTASANNHASPSGSLPFLLPASPDPCKETQPVPSGKLQRWALNNSESPIEEPGDSRYEAYHSLLDHRIRRAWVRTPRKTTRSQLTHGSSTPFTSPRTAPPSPSPSTSSPPPATPLCASRYPVNCVWQPSKNC